MTNSDLQIMYADFNRKYFHNCLPKDMEIRFEKIRGMGVTRFYYDRPLYININPKLNWSVSQVAMTLLHECVHVYLPARFNHGPRFHKEMLRLARIGAFKSWWIVLLVIQPLSFFLHLTM